MVKFAKGAAIGIGMVAAVCAGAYLVKKAHENGYKKGAESMAPYAEFYENHQKSGYGKVSKEDVRPSRNVADQLEDIEDIRPIGSCLQKVNNEVKEE